MERASLVLSAFGVFLSGGAWIWAYKASQRASKSLECLKQFNRAWYFHLIDPGHTKLVEDSASGMFLLALEAQPGDSANVLRDGVEHKVNGAKPEEG